MKKVLILSSLFVLFISFIGCKSIPEEALYSQEYIFNYVTESDEDCSFIFEFINQSKRAMRLEGYIAETKKLINQYDPDITSSLIVVEAGECLTFKIDADKLIKDFGRKYSIGINCFDKNWHWWQNINKGMKNNRFRIVVKNDSQEGGQTYNPPFKGENKFKLPELNVEYENRNYKGYLIIDTPDEYKQFFDTRVFYTNTSNNNGRVSNIYTCACKDLIQEFLEKGEFSTINVEGFKLLGLKNDPLDLNNYVTKENEEYDFIYEIMNNSSMKIQVANVLFDEKSQILTLSNDVEIEPGKTFQFKYDLNTLKKIYGEKNTIGADLKQSEGTKWIRGWYNNFDHKNDKHTVVVSDGTDGRDLDIIDVWTDFSNELERGMKIY